jgi:hypothetical protein
MFYYLSLNQYFKILIIKIIHKKINANQFKSNVIYFSLNTIKMVLFYLLNL